MKKFFKWKNIRVRNFPFKAVLCIFLSFFILCNFPYFAKSPKAFAQTSSGLDQNSIDKEKLNLVESNTLTVATSPDYPPFASLENGEITGYEADIWREIATRLGLKLNVQSVNFDAILTGVAGGTQYDLGISGISISSERKKTVNFSEPYYEADLSFAVRNNDTINDQNSYYTLKDESLKFAVQSGTTAETYVKENYPKAKCMSYSNSNDCFNAVASRQADVVCCTSAVVNNMLHGNFSNMNIVKNIATGEQYAVAINKHNSYFLEVVNNEINQMKSDGTLQKFALDHDIETSIDLNNMHNESLKTLKCTLSPNSDYSSDCLVGKETKLTWEFIAGKNEAFKVINLIFPKNTTLNTESIRLTRLYGSELMKRNVLDIQCDKNPSDSSTNLSITINNVSSVPVGSYFRLELSDVVFNTADNSTSIGGSYTTTSGENNNIKDIPYLNVKDMNVFEKMSQSLSDLDFIKWWNSFKFCELFLNPPIFIRSLPVVFNGFLMALGVVAVAFPVAIPFGLLLALMRISKFRILSKIAGLYVDIIRGTPLFLQIYIAFFGLPLTGIDIPNFVLGVCVLALNSSAYLCEIFRAGIQSISNGQFEASRSLGLTEVQTYVYIILPQMFERVIPTLTSEFILLYKDTSMLATVGLMEVVMYAKTIVASTGSVTPYITAAFFYLIITIPMSKLAKKIEDWFINKRRNKAQFSELTKKNDPIRAKIKTSKQVYPNIINEPSAHGTSGITPEQMGSV